MYPERESMSGYLASYVYQMDAHANELRTVVLFDSKETYLANAHRPETHAQCEQMLQFLAEEP